MSVYIRNTRVHSMFCHTPHQPLRVVLVSPAVRHFLLYLCTPDPYCLLVIPSVFKPVFVISPVRVCSPSCVILLWVSVALCCSDLYISVAYCSPWIVILSCFQVLQVPWPPCYQCFLVVLVFIRSLYLLDILDLTSPSVSSPTTILDFPLCIAPRV